MNGKDSFGNLTASPESNNSSSALFARLGRIIRGKNHQGLATKRGPDFAAGHALQPHPSGARAKHRAPTEATNNLQGSQRPCTASTA